MFKITLENHRFGKNAKKLCPANIKAVPQMEFKPNDKIEVVEDKILELHEIYEPAPNMSINIQKKTSNSKFKINLS